MGVEKTPRWGIDWTIKLRDKKRDEYFSRSFVQKEKGMKPIEKLMLGLIVAVSFLLATSGLSTALEVGDKAPDFELDSTKGGKLKLSSLKGKNVLINFYGRDFDPT
jgi:AhpC/TSA family